MNGNSQDMAALYRRIEPTIYSDNIDDSITHQQGTIIVEPYDEPFWSDNEKKEKK